MFASTSKAFFYALAILGVISGASADCDKNKCIGQMVSSGAVTAGSCTAAIVQLGGNPLADIMCAVNLIKTAVLAEEDCNGCSVAQPCNANDGTAQNNGCSQLGPNHCLQLSSSVPRPSKTDHKVGSYTFHCHNSGLVIGGDGKTCFWPCSSCNQCAGVPSSKRELEAVFFEA